MKQIIIPIDFSECSIGTAQYTIRIFAGHPDVNMVLYYMVKERDEEEAARLDFQSVKYGLDPELASRISTFVDFGTNYPEALCRYAREVSASMIVTCLSHNTHKIVEMNPCPVMILPLNVDFREIRTVALTSDFHTVDVHTPVESIRRVLEIFRPTLHIVNVNSDYYVSLSEESMAQKEKLAEMFREYEPQFDFLSLYDFQDSIHQFVEDNDIDLVITIPRHHSFFENLFRKHHTEEMVLHSSVPVVAAHE
ncbi:MAG: universal stress protein [Chitinophagaceae bacterium]|nr:MAG: universal stress protein [Chitinophagaceae bacterium]